ELTEARFVRRAVGDPDEQRAAAHAVRSGDDALVDVDITVDEAVEHPTASEATADVEQLDDGVRTELAERVEASAFHERVRVRIVAVEDHDRVTDARGDERVGRVGLSGRRVGVVALHEGDACVSSQPAELGEGAGQSALWEAELSDVALAVAREDSAV